MSGNISKAVNTAITEKEKQELFEIADRVPNLHKNPDSSSGDRVTTHLTVGFRNGAVGDYSFSSGGSEKRANQASGESSAVVGGANNKVTGEKSVIAGGEDNVSGGRGYKVVSVSGEENGIGSYTLNTVDGLEAGMEYSVQLDNYRCCPGNILSVNKSDNTVTVNGYKYVKLGKTDNYLQITGRPDLGDAEIGGSSFSAGSKNQAAAKNVFVCGKNNIALGPYSTVTGKENMGGYAAAAGGREVHVFGDYSFGHGLYVDIPADCSCGIGTYLTVTGEYQTVLGKFNAENPDAMFIVGNGDWYNGRKNVFEVFADGRAAVATNPLNPKDVATKEYVDGMLSDGLESLTWEAISSICRSGKSEMFFEIGDKKTISIDGVAYSLRIVGMNADSVGDESYGRRKAGITFELSGVLSTQEAMNDTKTAVGGWGSSKMRTVTLPNILNKLPSELQKVIVPVKKVTDTGYDDGGSLENAQKPVETTDKLFLLSEKEVFGNNALYSVCGEQYDYYKAGNSAKKSSRTWFLRSPVSTYAIGGLFAIVTYDSGTTGNIAADNKQSVSFAFCV